MKQFLVASFALLCIKVADAYNPYVTATYLKGCDSLEVGSSHNLASGDFIHISDLKNNIPQKGEIIRTKVCFQGPSSLIIELANKNVDPTYELYASKFFFLSFDIF